MLALSRADARGKGNSSECVTIVLDRGNRQEGWGKELKLQQEWLIFTEGSLWTWPDSQVWQTGPQIMVSHHGPKNSSQSC